MSLLTFWFLFLGECSMGLLYRLGIYNWRLFICPDHTEMVAGKVIYFYRAFLVGITKQNITLH